MMTTIRNPFEEFLTLREAAERLNLPLWKLELAVRQQVIPHYKFINNRRYVRLSEVLMVMNVTLEKEQSQ